jgi:hypothetical protein
MAVSSTAMTMGCIAMEPPISCLFSLTGHQWIKSGHDDSWLIGTKGKALAILNLNRIPVRQARA